jgi:glycosyltransferase involved in cell wall biosynthesis
VLIVFVEQTMNPVTMGLVPAYNEESSIGKVIRELRPYVDKVIVCDDGSVDRTALFALQEGAEVIRHRKNRGYGAALRSLFGYALRIQADVSVTVDGDGQHDPRSIPPMVSAILQGRADLVLGSRFLAVRSDIPLLRRLAIGGITKLTGLLLGYSPTDAQCGIRAYNNKALKATCPTIHHMGASVEILERAREADLRISEEPAYVRYDISEPPIAMALIQMSTVVMTIFRLRFQKQKYTISSESIVETLLEPVGMTEVIA